MSYLVISEDFFSVQGEGPETGFPAYFIRLKNCNLTCGATRSAVNNLRDQGQENVTKTEFIGDLEKNNSATWTCDSIPVWIFGHKKPFDYITTRWADQRILDDVISGVVHIIWTGGEPGIVANQNSIVEFHQYFKDFCIVNKVEEYSPYVEIETNGTQILHAPMMSILDRINCSPKLSNSGLAKDARIKPEAIKSIMKHPNHSFKFVVSTEDDMKEAFADYINPFNMNIKNVCIMPGMNCADNFHERTQFVLELAKKYKVRGLQRLHISAWNKVTGV